MTDDNWPVCDKCHKPILPGQLIYTLATSRDGKTGRHADCQDAHRAELTSDLKNRLAKVKSIIRNLR